LNAIRKLINVEHKITDNSAFSSTSSASGAINNLVGVAQGTDFANRVGDSIRAQQLSFSITVTRNGTDGCFRFIIFRDTENQGATPAAADVISSVGTVSNIVSPYNWFNKNTNDGKNRIVILHDEVFVITANNTNVHRDLEFPSTEMKHIRFRGTASSAGSMAEGHLFALFITDQSANQPTYSWFSRLTFTDD
jgi:hypothetical protein